MLHYQLAVFQEETVLLMWQQSLPKSGADTHTVLDSSHQLLDVKQACSNDEAEPSSPSQQTCSITTLDSMGSCPPILVNPKALVHPRH